MAPVEDPAYDSLNGDLPVPAEGPSAGELSRNGSPPEELCTDLVATMESELRVVAASMLASERPDHTLQPTALINELWLRIAASEGRPHGRRARFDSRAAFMAYATKAIRHILVSHARKNNAAKRGGAEWTRIGDCGAMAGDSDGSTAEFLRGVSLLDLDDELNLLEKVQIRGARVFEMRFFGGMSSLQVARWLNVPERTVRQEWNFARTWLASRLRTGCRQQEGIDDDTDS